MMRALALSLAQLGDRRIVAVMVRSLLLSIVLFAAAGAGLYLLIRHFADRLALLGDGTAAAVAAVLVTLLLALLLWRAVAIAVIGLFAEDVVDAVEARHYPARRESARAPGIAVSAGLALRSFSRAIVINLAMSPLYIALLFSGIGLPIAFAVVNGWLIGLDLQEMVAVRHWDGTGDWQLPGATRFMLGLGALLLLAIPVAGLIAPVLGAAMATHLVHGRAAAARGGA